MIAWFKSLFASKPLDIREIMERRENAHLVVRYKTPVSLKARYQFRT